VEGKWGLGRREEETQVLKAASFTFPPSDFPTSFPGSTLFICGRDEEKRILETRLPIFR